MMTLGTYAEILIGFQKIVKDLKICSSTNRGAAALPKTNMYMYLRVCTCTLFANITLRACILLSRGQTKVSYSRHRTMRVNPFDPMAGECRLPTLTLRKAGGAFCPSLFTPTPSDVRAVLVAGDWCPRRHGEASLPCRTHASGIYAIIVGTRASVTARYMQHRPTTIAIGTTFKGITMAGGGERPSSSGAELGEPMEVKQTASPSRSPKDLYQEVRHSHCSPTLQTSSAGQSRATGKTASFGSRKATHTDSRRTDSSSMLY
jgi:hypothetical protein